MKGQIVESGAYGLSEVKPLDTPEAVFNWLKLRTTYKHDPKNIELFQTLETLLDNNFHGVPGAGDCDCFTIAALGLLIANGMDNCGIVLAGRSPLYPVHIWAYCDYKGKRFNLDLTNRYFDQTRPYPYLQYIPLRLTKNDQNMMLQLAEGTRRRGAVNVQGHKRRYPLHESGQLDYIYLPSKRVHVREDYLDGMSAGEFQSMCLSEGFEVSDIEQLSAKRAERKANKQTSKAGRKETKTAAKATKKEAAATKKTTKAAGKVDKKLTKQTRKGDKAQAKIGVKQTKAENKDYMTSGDKAATVSKLFDVGGTLIGKYVGGKKVTGGDDDDDSNPLLFPQAPGQRPPAPTMTTTTTTTAPVNPYAGKETEPDSEIDLGFTKVSKTTAVIGGLALLGLGIAVAKGLSKNK